MGFDPCVPSQVVVQAEGGPSADRVGVSRVDRREFFLLWVLGPQAGWLYSPMLEDVAVTGVLTMSSFLGRMF